MSVLFNEADKAFRPENLTGKAKEVYEASQKGMDPNYSPDKETKDALGTDLNRPAKYKIEVVLSTDRNKIGPSACMITIFKSGGALHGGGDELMYTCRSEKDRDMGCGKILKGDVWMGMSGNQIVTAYHCPTCKKYVNRELLGSSTFYKLPVKKIAENIYKFFRELDSDADIYLKHIKVDVRKSMENRKEMAKVPTKMEYAIYTVQNIMKDAGNNSQILKKIEDFILV